MGTPGDPFGLREPTPFGPGSFTPDATFSRVLRDAGAPLVMPPGFLVGPADDGGRNGSMDEREWLTSTDPVAMLEWNWGRSLAAPGSRRQEGVSDRKLRLFACACMATAGRPARQLDPFYAAAESGDTPHRSGAFTAIEQARAWVAGNPEPPTAAEKATLLRCVFGNPFRPLRSPWDCRLCGGSVSDDWADGRRRCDECSALQPLIRWLDWNDATVPRLAEAIYRERAFDRCPILADAIEEAGCTDAAILNHLRGLTACPDCLGSGTEADDSGGNVGVVRWCRGCGGRGWVRPKRRKRCPCGGEYAPLKKDYLPLLSACAKCRKEGPFWVDTEEDAPAVHVRGCWCLDLILGRE